MQSQSNKGLFNHTSETYEGCFKSDLIEQYKLYVQSVENVSARRVSSSRYLLTVNAALVALYSLQILEVSQTTLLIPVAIVGIAISLLSFNVIKSHRDLNRVKFKVIHELENHLPADLYAYEWQLADEGRGKAYRSISQIEQWIPVLFLILHMGALTLLIVLTTVGVPDWAR